MSRFSTGIGHVAAIALCWLAPGSPAWSQTSPSTSLTIHAGTEIPLATLAAISSKTAAKGDLFDLEVTQDVIRDGRVIVPKGTRGVGELTRAETSGSMGVAGALEGRLLYIIIGDDTVRLEGLLGNLGQTSTGTVIASFMITPIIKGKSAAIPAGTKVTGIVEHDALIAR
jgi:hypothetical protein